MNKLSIAVIFGGKSTEHEVSVITGLQVLNNIDKSKYNIIPIYVSKKGEWFTSGSFYHAATFKDLNSIPKQTKSVSFSATQLNPKLIIGGGGLLSKKEEIKIDVFFPCFHGGLGEGGGFSGLFELSNTAYVGSGILGSALGLDKVAMRDIFKAHQIPQTDYVWFYRQDWESKKNTLIPDLENRFSYPMFVKPANSGSSIGVTRAKNREELENAVEVANILDKKVVIEKAITDAKEINVSVIGNSGSTLEVSACEQVFANQDFLDYDQKYKASGGKSEGMASTKREIPAKISQELENKLKNLAKKVFSCLNCHGLARVDFFVKEESNKIFVIEINTIPGSMSFYLWEASGLSFKSMITKLIELAQAEFEEKKKTTVTFSSNILQNFQPSLKAPHQ